MMFEVYASDCKVCHSLSCHCRFSSNVKQNWYDVAAIDPAGKAAIAQGTADALETYLRDLESELQSGERKREFSDEKRSYRVFIRKSRAIAGESLTGKGIKLSQWINEDHCSMRCIEGTDPEVVANRVAFIEKTPRVRVARAESPSNDWQGWHEGPKGCSEEYGRYAPSREWCDEQLKMLGYELK